jgi:gliding motility-associated-like protein
VISPAIPDLCAGGTYNLGLSSNLGAGGTWSGTGVSGSTFTATTTPTAPFQSFSVSLANVPCTAATQNVKVYALPTAYPVTGGGNVCPGSTSGGPQIFVSNSAVGVSYQLYLNGTTIIGAPVPGNGGSISLGSQNTPGTYTVVGSLSTSPFCSIQMLDSAVITAVPYPTAYAVTGGGAYCSGDTGRSVGLANTDLNISYYLYNGVTLIAGPVAGTGGPLNFGTYTAVGNYSATATNIAGCLTNMLDTVNIRILALPTIAGINAGSVTCFGGSDDTITISGTSFNGALHYSIDSGVSYPNTTGVFTGQTAGSYYVYVRDDSACTVKYVANPVVVNQPPDIFVSVASYSNVLCNGDSTGYINVSASGGVAPLTFAWSNGSTSQNISNLGIGNYTVTVTDGHNCQKTLSQLITQPNALTDSASGTNISCNGANDGTATVIAAGGTTPYKFQWSNGDTSQTITGLSAALYSVTVTDKNGCRAVSSYTVIDPPALSVSIAASNILCNGGNNGSITVTATGGTGVYSYTWSPNVSTTATASNIGPGTYYVTVSDANNCSRTDSAVITQPLAALSVSSIVTPVGCTNDSNGAIQLLPSGGAGGYTYSWSTGQALQIISSLPAGTYTGSVTDANGCVTSITNILLNPTPIVSSVVGTSSTCAGAGGGSATLTVSGGVAPYTFLWSNFETTQNLSNLSGGTYRVIITDANGCKHADSVTITQPLPLVISISSTNVACFGAATGTINVSVSGGTGTYSYAWTPNVSTTSTVTNASPGTYVVTVTDANLCSVTDSATITQPAAAISATAVVTPTTCNNSNNGSITLLVSGGTGSYTYSWTGGAITPTISNLAAGTYYVTVTDANGCTTVDSGAITNPTPITSTVTGTNVACAGGANGTASVTSVSGGTGPYTYLWSNFAATSTISNLSGGLYRVIITDANGCEHRDSVLITEPQPLVVTLSSTNANCAGSNNGTITAGVTGGTGAYSYAWTPNVSTTASVTNASPGTYVLTVTDANLCSVTDSVTITQPQGLSAVMTVTNVVCYGANNGSVTVNATGGSGVYTYTWAPVANATATLSNVGPGTYHVTVTDANGCTLVDSAKVRQPTSPIVITSVVHDITCYGVNDGSVLVVASGGTGSYTYIWSTGQTTQYVQGLSALPSPIVTPIYVVTVTDANGCTAVMRDTLHEPPQIISSVTGTDVTCAGANNGSVTLTVTGGRGAYTFFWSNFATTQNLTNIPGGFYTVVITDSSGCQNTDTITINQPQPLTLSIQSTNVSCNGSNTGAITASVTGGTGAYQYTWSPNVSTTATVANAIAGTYHLTVTDANGCTITDSVTITQPAYPLSVTATVSNITCNNANNGAITLTVNGGSGFYTYAWTGSAATTSSINGLSAGTYTATVTDANGCSATAGGTITNPAAITSGIVATNVTCAGASNGSAILTVSGGTGAYTFQWSDATISQNLSNVPGGHYFVIITDSNGCRHEDSVTITEPQPLVGTITGTNVSCFGAANGTVTVSVTGGTGAYTYTWSPSVSTTATVSNAAPGTYSVTVKDANNCSIVKSITITQPVSGLLVQSNVVNISCSGNSNGSISLSVSGGTPAYTFLWGGGQQTQNISNLSAGIYHATVTDANGCSVVVADTVKVPTAITSSVTGTNVTCAGADNGTATLTVSGGQTPYTYLWSNFAGTQSVDSLSGGTYHVIITDANGCQHRDSVIISEPQPLVTTLAVTPISCNNTNDGTIIATTTGGTGNDTYLWAPGGQTSSTITNLSAGIYSVTVKDANNCTTSQFATLVNPAPLTAASVVINPTCNGSGNGTITLIVNGGTPQYGYVWSGGLTAGQSATNVAPGDYYVTVTDSHGCIATDSAKVIAPAPILVSAIITNVSCAGSMNGSIIATGYGGVLPYSYQWYADSINGPLGPITKDWTQVAGGNYFLVITDANNCSASFQAIVKEADSLKITLSKTDLTCYGANNGVVSVATTGGVTPYHYLWNDFTTDSSQTGIAAGTYGVVVTDSNGCQQTKTITVNQPQPISINLTGTSPACSGANTGTIAVSANGGTGGYTYSWSTTPPQSTATASNLGAGTYYVTVSDGNSCSQVDSTTLSAPQALQVNTAISNPTCSDGDNGFISLDVHGGSAPYTYSWSTTPAQTGNVASGLAGGTYAATITDTRGCQYLDTALAVVAPQPIVITIGTVGGATCISSADGYAVVNVSGGLAPYTYQLGTLAQNSDTFGHLVPGSYSLSVKDANACTAITSWTIVTSSNFSVTLTADHDAILAGQPVQLTATPVSDTTVTAYIWTPSDSLNFSGCGNPSDCPNPIATPTASTTYIVQAQNARGCLATDTIHISVADQPSVFVPTAFTPNGDGLNDKFQFDILGATTINVQIWNRWGEKVFSNPAQSNGVNSTDGWDGTYRDKKAEYDTYTYQLVVTYFDGHQQTMAGTVVLMR